MSERKEPLLLLDNSTMYVIGAGDYHSTNLTFEEAKAMEKLRDSSKGRELAAAPGAIAFFAAAAVVLAILWGSNPEALSTSPSGKCGSAKTPLR